MYTYKTYLNDLIERKSLGNFKYWYCPMWVAVNILSVKFLWFRKKNSLIQESHTFKVIILAHNYLSKDEVKWIRIFILRSLCMHVCACVCVCVQILNEKGIILIHLHIFWGLEASGGSRVQGEVGT